MKLVIDLDADPCVFIEVTPHEHDQLKREGAVWRNSGIFSHLMEQSSEYSRMVAVMARCHLLPEDWSASRAMADATRLHGTVHEFVFGIPLRVVTAA